MHTSLIDLSLSDERKKEIASYKSSAKNYVYKNAVKVKFVFEMVVFVGGPYLINLVTGGCRVITNVVMYPVKKCISPYFDTSIKKTAEVAGCSIETGVKSSYLIKDFAAYLMRSFRRIW